MWPVNTSKTNATVDDGGAMFIAPALRDPHRLKMMTKDTADPPIHTEYSLSLGGTTTLILIVDGANAVSSFVMRSKIHLEHRRAT